ncbi:hypothetical protein [Bradyrhizobium sp.]|uniref:hypothetical protein n=1 Tax=Bradyrhizobium sp. TaxID=376 RepID=UPI001DAF3B8B|nr:hypothetical protein [Bradyrhizobium sp.]MBI5320614.1 hypothetical protein [Bradyrhizobium sp.]
MFRQGSLNGATSRVFSGEDTLRHPDGSIDFDAYRERARRARTAAIKASGTAVLSLIAGVFAGKPVAAARHQAT